MRRLAASLVILRPRFAAFVTEKHGGRAFLQPELKAVREIRPGKSATSSFRHRGNSTGIKSALDLRAGDVPRRRSDPGADRTKSRVPPQRHPKYGAVEISTKEF